MCRPPSQTVTGDGITAWGGLDVYGENKDGSKQEQRTVPQYVQTGNAQSAAAETKECPGIIEITNGDVLFCMNNWHQEVEASRANASLTADQLAELKERSNA